MILVIGGPTAAGKTEAALAVAERFSAVIVSADAMQVYRGMDIGTAKVTAAERARVEHFGIDIREPVEAFDASEFVAMADRVIAEHPRVVVCGGTSFYLRSLVRGLVETPPVDRELRAAIEALPDPHGELRKRDPELADRLHPNDRVRIVRGLEVWMQTNTTLSALQREHAQQPDRVESRAVWMDRDDLRERIGRRLQAMMAGGYLDEVRGLLERGVPRDCKPMQSLGYRHLGDSLVEGLPIDEAVRRTERDTWELARKQRNWMRVLGYPRGGVDEAMRAAAEIWGGG